MAHSPLIYFRYMDQLNMWMKHFPREQFYFLHIADLKENSIRTYLKEITLFLGNGLFSTPMLTRVPLLLILLFFRYRSQLRVAR